MTEKPHRKRQVAVAKVVNPSRPLRIGIVLLLAAFVYVLMSKGLKAEEPKAEPAVTDPPSIQLDDTTAAVSEISPPGKVEKANPMADWKPPKMPEPPPFSSQKIDTEIAKELKERWGVELLGMRRTAAGNFLDFRFKVLDAEKSLPLFDHRIKPYVIAERSNIKLPVPMAAKVGAFRPTNRGKNIKADKIYYMLFGNPDRHVKDGETVTVVIGDFKVEHLVVN